MNELIAAFQPAPKTTPKTRAAANQGSALAGRDDAAAAGGNGAVEASPPAVPLAQRLPQALAAGSASDFGEGYCRGLLSGVGVEPKKAAKDSDDAGAEGGQDDATKKASGGDAAAEATAAAAVPFVRPLLVVGMPRSGQGLLSLLLASHPNILAGDEYNFLTGESRRGREVIA
jgi:hypothetical protein